MSDLRRDIESAINRNNAEHGSNTPDYILARFLEAALAAFDLAVRDRDEWHGFEPKFGSRAVPESACTCGSPETYSLNPNEVVVHCVGGPCYIAPAHHERGDQLVEVL